jgi:hypothetical protein
MPLDPYQRAAGTVEPLRADERLCVMTVPVTASAA